MKISHPCQVSPLQTHVLSHTWHHFQVALLPFDELIPLSIGRNRDYMRVPERSGIKASQRRNCDLPSGPPNKEQHLSTWGITEGKVGLSELAKGV